MMDFQSKPNFMDSRFDSFEHHGVMQDDGRMMDLNDSLELMDKYRIDHALLQDSWASLTFSSTRLAGGRDA